MAFFSTNFPFYLQNVWFFSLSVLLRRCFPLTLQKQRCVLRDVFHGDGLDEKRARRSRRQKQNMCACLLVYTLCAERQRARPISAFELLFVDEKCERCDRTRFCLPNGVRSSERWIIRSIAFISSHFWSQCVRWMWQFSAINTCMKRTRPVYCLRSWMESIEGERDLCSYNLCRSSEAMVCVRFSRKLGPASFKLQGRRDAWTLFQFIKY